MQIYDDYIASEREKEVLRSLKSSSGPGATVFAQLSLHETIKKKLKGPPIIVCSGGSVDVFNMLNIKDFLQAENFISVKEKKSQGAKKEHSIKITRVYENQEYEFQIVDNVSRFSENDWQRVVAVFVSGQAWQFKGWKWSSMVDIFQNVLGIYVYLKGSVIKPSVKEWNVKQLEIHSDMRHLDRSAARQCWKLIFSVLHKKQGTFGAR